MQIHVHVKIILCSPFTIKFSFVSHSTKKELEEVINRLEDMQENMMIEWKVSFPMQFTNLLWMQIIVILVWNGPRQLTSTWETCHLNSHFKALGHSPL